MTRIINTLINNIKLRTEINPQKFLNIKIIKKDRKIKKVLS